MSQANATTVTLLVDGEQYVFNDVSRATLREAAEKRFAANPPASLDEALSRARLLKDRLIAVLAACPEHHDHEQLRLWIKEKVRLEAVPQRGDVCQGNRR